jgi:hypothetical protein
LTFRVVHIVLDEIDDIRRLLIKHGTCSFDAMSKLGGYDRMGEKGKLI